ncbi:SDR family oxidoreductase [Chondrinema litorale]|uniref:SDR family oxidoreductase n=1 Tax=Chondrinema litorale TaxID=2994555 RepID=UPI0025433B67|nr:SDR family oxidoreductase [Chondrinema litorale]UZR98780.1 SDR family oxidoreductase [Chondrinema litorale]
MTNKKVWFITGASKGLGLSLVNKLLKEGYKVAATSRSAENLKKAVIGANEANFLPLEVDLTNTDSIKEAIQTTNSKLGSLDVIVNNAGYGIGGTVEELSDEEITQSFDVNVFATIKVMQHALPILRKQGSGHIINISSIAGFAPASGWAMYAATKYAIMGLSEVLAEDVKSLGINVTVVAPGAFRTEFLTQESLVFSEEKIDAYQTVRDSHAKYLTMDGKQNGDPDKAADVFIQLAESENPPVRFYMGSDAYNRALSKIDLLKRELEENKSTSYVTDY